MTEAVEQRTGCRKLEEKKTRWQCRSRRGRISGRAGKKKGTKAAREPNRTTAWVKHDR